MTKHLADTLQQRHLEYMNAQAASGRAETAPMLGTFDEERYLLGTFHDETIKSILKAAVKFDEFAGTWTNEQPGPAGQMSPVSERQRAMRRRRVTFSPLVSQCIITPYSEVYNRHPRDFVFDAIGRHIVGVSTVPAPHTREAKIEATEVGPSKPLPLSELTLYRRRSSEEEFEPTHGKFGTGSQSVQIAIRETIRHQTQTAINACASDAVLAQAPRAPVVPPLMPIVTNCLR